MTKVESDSGVIQKTELTHVRRPPWYESTVSKCASRLTSATGPPVTSLAARRMHQEREWSPPIPDDDDIDHDLQ